MLLSEANTNIKLLSEGNDGKKDLYLEGIFMQAEKKNKNGRVYPKAVMEKAVSKYITEFVQTGKALGEIDHPNRVQVDLNEAAIIIESLNWDGDNVIGKAKVLNTPKGNILKGLLEGGYSPSVSSRGTGSVVNESGTNIVQSDFELSAIDFVANPSAHDANPTFMMEAEQKVSEGIDDLLVLIKQI